MRASDTDRQRAIEELRRHCAAGRIDVDEYASRIERALGATSLEELDELRADLPMMRIAEPVGRRDRPGGPLTLAGRVGGDGGDSHRERLLALTIVVLAVAVVLSAIVIALTAEWGWAVVLLAGWAAGLVQGHLSRRRAER